MGYTKIVTHISNLSDLGNTVLRPINTIFLRINELKDILRAKILQPENNSILKKVAV
jgi:hypothetical protein